MNHANDAQNNSQVKLTLNLKEYLARYEGLDISEVCSFAPSGDDCETILIEEWVQPEWSTKPLLKRDFPHMGYVSYSESPPQ